MQINLSQKEKMFLEEAKLQEDICVQKYRNYAQQTKSTELAQLFNKHATDEQHHHDTVDQLLQGIQPNLNNSNQPQQTIMKQNSQVTTTQTNSMGAINNTEDKMFCIDLLSTEKYVSGTYDTDVFESANPVVRQVMQHIQKDEQKHGEDLFNYMNTHGMYNVK